MDYFTLRRREFETTLRVLQAYPDDQAHMRPAAKSRTAAELAMTLVNEERVMTSLLETGGVSPSALATEIPSSMAAIINVWQHAVAKNDAMLETLSPEGFAKIVDFYGMRYVVPVVVSWPGTVLAVNVGGAGTFDGIFLTGILAVLLAGIAAPSRPRPAW